MKPAMRKAIKHAEGRGFIFERENSRGLRYYRDGAGHEIGINPHGDEKAARSVMQQIDRSIGIGPDLTQKRNPAAVRERQIRDRELVRAERARHQARLDDLAREKAALLFNGSQISLLQAKAIERLIEAEERHHREVVQQMTARPTSNKESA